MNAKSTESEISGNEPGCAPSLQVLKLARQLDRFGRHAEEFLRLQFERLEREIEEFEREKSAWRRQLRRESSQLVRERNELEREKSRRRDPDVAAASNSQEDAAAATAALARSTGAAPIRILLRPNEASSSQVGLFIFELSKLNREMGGRGLRLEIAEVRTPAKRLFRRSDAMSSAAKILELTAHSALPLVPRGAHVALDVDITDRIQDWVAFKTRLLQSTLKDDELAAAFRQGTPVGDMKLCSSIREASRRADDAGLQSSGYSSVALFANTPIDSVQQQAERVESCCESLKKSSGLRIHIELYAAD